MYFKLTLIAVLAFAASVAVEAGSDVSKSSSAALQLRADSSQTHGSPSAALTWMINGQGDDVSRIGPVVVTCDPNYKTLAKENPCAGVDFFVRMTPGLEEHIKVIIVRDDVSGRYVSSTASTSLSDADSGHTSQKLCGEWTLDECFVNRQFTYTSSWKDLNNAYTAVTALAADGNQTTSNAGSIISHEARGVQYSSRIAGSMYNVHLNSRHIYIQLDGWTPEISKMMSLHSFIQVEVRFNGSNSLRTGLYGFGLSALLILLLGVGLFNIRKVGLRRYGLIDQLRPIQIWSFGVNGQSVVPVPVLQLPEIVGQPVTPARLLRQKKERVNAAGTEATAVTPTAEDEPTWRDRLFSLMGGVKRPQFERAPVEETADIDAAPSGKVSTVVDIEERQADTQPLRERREDDDDEMTHRDAVSGKAEPPAIASDDDPDELICRICQDGSPRNDLFAPCKCSGTSKYVHKQCLDHWRHSTANPLHRTTCAECKTLYVEKPPEAPSPGACLTPIARQLKLATGFAALLLFGGYAVKWLAFLMTRDAGINWWPNEYHVFLGSMFVISELMTVSCCAHFFTGFPIHFTRSVLWIAGWMLPAAFGYVAQFFIWVTEVVVWRPEISYGAGVAALFVTSQYFLPTLNEYVQRAEMTYLLERESATRQQHAETLAAMAAAAAAARAQRAANAQGDEEPHNADTDEETTDEEVEMAPQPADDAAAVPSPVAQPPPAPTTTQDDSLSPSREA